MSTKLVGWCRPDCRYEWISENDVRSDEQYMHIDAVLANNGTGISQVHLFLDRLLSDQVVDCKVCGQPRDFGPFSMTRAFRRELTEGRPTGVCWLSYRLPRNNAVTFHVRQGYDPHEMIAGVAQSLAKHLNATPVIRHVDYEDYSRDCGRYIVRICYCR